MKPDFTAYLISYLLFLPILTIHETAHAWVAHKCGDDTAKAEGRVSLNPLVHLDMIGTVMLPLLNMFLGGWLIGWGKPVPVNPGNFRRYRFHDTLVALAGPISNILLAAAAVAVLRVGVAFDSAMVKTLSLQLAYLSIYLGFFNLIPVPPLDGSHFLKNLLRVDEAWYARFSLYGFILLFVLIQLPPVAYVLRLLTETTLTGLLRLAFLGSGGA
jgi:Zn-dependent protease